MPGRSLLTSTSPPRTGPSRTQVKWVCEDAEAHHKSPRIKRQCVLLRPAHAKADFPRCMQSMIGTSGCVNMYAKHRLGTTYHEAPRIKRQCVLLRKARPMRTFHHASDLYLLQLSMSTIGLHDSLFYLWGELKRKKPHNSSFNNFAIIWEQPYRRNLIYVKNEFRIHL